MKFNEILQKTKESWREFVSNSETTIGKEIQRKKVRNKGMDPSLPFATEDLLTEQQLLYISEYYLVLR
ncbi:hypothetical protein A0128_08515 [Leptospira tipperaryensis]|uniref:Uncharacterized protein n=1 Tax=Leptospira tipperaryensis TaxID=2564040 RepID=A0A1D7UW91_9LEPT|nr:hypothetical protein [Leptospira tipperaryensis]AOP33880.1 hypothetical protein A0128_08515 [Leptospira tipperaryensis]